MRKPLFAVLLFLPFSATAQRGAGFYGAVSGNIVCTDTNLPARLIEVTLMPVPEPPVLNARPDKPVARTLSTYQSHLDGSFLIPHVAPGRYYVIAQKPGYLSPVAQYTRDEVERPTPEMRATLEKTIPAIAVAANQTSTINIALVRAASISGTIKWDDGTPAAGLSVRFRRRDNTGKWVPVSVGGAATDDLGHFHAGGLPAAEYQVSTGLAIDEIFRDAIFGDTSSMASQSKQSIAIYYGDTFLEKDAKPLKIGDGEDVSADLSIPVSKLHTLTGALVDARSGHVINAGKVTLSTAQGNEEIVTADVDNDEPVFRFEFIPEGEYTLRVTGAQDVARQEIPNCAGCIGTRQFKTTVLKSYGTYEAPFVMQTDRANMMLPIPAATAPASGRP